MTHAILFLAALVAAIVSIALLPAAKGGVRSVLILVAILAGGAMAYLVMGAHVL
jgi:hypothetical protein